ncbi:Syntaxin-4 [Strongyloides ratti]|uniref:Syntaxin-4 n=1 Tax=Strongyloides ratti TaxID=34506 RepID=A0A090LDR4_STRRB|nr:Syntaxin-4 [Strongyloides ratti]CEF67941.1 Syntaxin-4 [Strongyloides ratti]
MTVKDRSIEFYDLKILNNQRGSVIIMDEENGLKLFFDVVENIRKKIKELDEIIDNLDMAKKDMICETYSNMEIYENVTNLIKNFDINVQIIRKELKNMEEQIKYDENYPNGVLPTFQKIRKIHLNHLILRFKEIVIRYNQSQEEYKNCCKERISRRLLLEGYYLNEEQLDEIVENGMFNISTNNINVGFQLIEDVKSRHKEILKLEKSVLKLFTLFQDILFIVDSQNEVIDRIEENIEYAEAKVFQARKYAILASRQKKRLLKAQLFCGLLCIFLIIITALLLYSYLK